MNENTPVEEESSLPPGWSYPPRDVMDAKVAELMERWKDTLDLLAEHDRNYD